MKIIEEDVEEAQWVVVKALQEVVVVAVEYIQAEAEAEAEDVDRDQLRLEDPSDGRLPDVDQGAIFFPS